MIDERLKIETTLIAESKLSELRLMHDGELDWFLVIPKVEVTEFIDLSVENQRIIWDEVMLVSQVLRSEAEFDKLNIGALGNQVSYLHVHVIARKKTDRAWPGAIWGTKSQIEFDKQKVEFWQEKFKKTSFAK